MANFQVLAIGLDEDDAPKKFVQSLRETGFAIIKDHGIDAERVDDFYSGWADFFASDEKFSHAPENGAQVGYFGYKSENAKDSTFKDLKEFYHIYKSGPVPEKTAAPTRAMHRDLIAIGETLLSWLDAETPDDVRASFLEPLKSMVSETDHNLLRVLHYPALTGEIKDGEMRAAPHEDINLITLLLTGTEAGLQAKDAKGEWHNVPCQAGYITVNSGDMLMKASKGYYPSTTHRVVNPPCGQNRSRYSMPLFMHPRPEVRLDADQTAGEYLEERLREIGLKA